MKTDGTKVRERTFAEQFLFSFYFTSLLSSLTNYSCLSLYLHKICIVISTKSFPLAIFFHHSERYKFITEDFNT